MESKFIQLTPMRRQHIHRFDTFIVLAGWLISTVSLPVIADESLCPDMDKHQRVLDEGQKFHEEHGQAPSSFSHHPLMMFPAELRGGKPRSGIERAPPGYEIYSPSPAINYDYLPQYVSGVDVESMPLKSVLQIDCAELTARSLEAAGNYSSARRLYQRILSARTSNPKISRIALDSSAADLTRVALFETAITNMQNQRHDEAVSVYSRIITAITSQRNIDLSDKIALLKPVVSALSNPWAEKTVRGREVGLEAQRAYDSYKKEWQCIEMAEKLDRCASKLENDTNYAMAEKLCKESLAIREKHLGKEAPETLTEYGNLARIYAAQGNYPEAQRVYDQAIAVYRKIGIPDSTYASLLENYGDMLNQLHRSQAADKIYGEAREVHERMRSRVPDPSSHF